MGDGCWCAINRYTWALNRPDLTCYIHGCVVFSPPRHKDPSLLPSAVCEISTSSWLQSLFHNFFFPYQYVLCMCVCLSYKWTVICVSSNASCCYSLSQLQPLLSLLSATLQLSMKHRRWMGLGERCFWWIALIKTPVGQECPD